MTLADDFQQAGEIAISHFRDSFLLAFETMTDGLLGQKKREARKILRFFENETDSAVWEKLKQMPDPQNPAQSIADSWLAQWQQLDAAVGGEPKGVAVSPTTFSKGAAAGG